MEILFKKYTSKFGSWDEMVKFLKRHKVLVLTKDEVDNMNWPVSSN